MLRHVDLCSGIGGFALGFQWAQLSKPVLFCDNDHFCQQVLAKHWPDVPIAGDVEELSLAPDRFIPNCDIITAGYPCPPFSLAGKRRGEKDDRHIWPYICKIIAHKRPTWCVFENVYGHVSLGLDTVLSDLEAEGYATRAFVVPACSVDAPHRRDRVWIIASHADSESQSDVTGYGEEGQWLGWAGNAGNAGCLTKGQSCGGFSQEQFNSKAQGQWSVEGHRFADTGKDVADTDSWEAINQWGTDKFRRNALGRGEQASQQENGKASANSLNGCGKNVPNADSQRLQRIGQKRGDEKSAGLCGGEARWGKNFWQLEPSVGGVADGLSTWLDEPKDIPRVATGVKQRTARLKGLGNAIVPQIAMRIGQTIKAIHYA